MYKWRVKHVEIVKIVNLVEVVEAKGVGGRTKKHRRSKHHKKHHTAKHHKKHPRRHKKRKVNEFFKKMLHAKKHKLKDFHYKGKKYVAMKTKTGMTVYKKA